jgi:hypothetical protein
VARQCIGLEEEDGAVRSEAGVEVASCSEAWVKAVACSEARHETAMCSRPRIENGRRRWHDSF